MLRWLWGCWPLPTSLLPGFLLQLHRFSLDSEESLPLVTAGATVEVTCRSSSGPAPASRSLTWVGTVAGAEERAVGEVGSLSRGALCWFGLVSLLNLQLRSFPES